MELKFCKKCVLPNTRPGLVLNSDEVCNICNAKPIPLLNFKERISGLTHCLIPVSGGKDSFWQVVTCLNAKMEVNAITWKSPLRNKLGQKNLDALIKLGISHVDFSLHYPTEQQEIKHSFEHYGEPARYIHWAIKSLSVYAAKVSKSCLIVWGENPVREYGCNAMGENASNEIYLGDYFPYDPRTSFEVASQHGFQAAEKPMTGYYNYADIDDPIVAVHHWLKWYKFGFTRLHDNLSLEIRHGRMTRNEALKIIQESGDQTPWLAIDEFCAYLKMNRDQFFEIAERFKNHEIHSQIANVQSF